MSDGKRPLGFVNRRGHGAGISKDDLDGLDIESQPVVISEKDSKNTEIKSSTSPKERKRTVRRLRWSRRKTVLLIFVIAVIVLIPVIIGELLRAQYLSSASSAHEQVESLVAIDVLPLQKKSDITSKQVYDVITKLETVRDSMCPGGVLDNVATLYPRANSAHTACIAQREQIAALATLEREAAAQLAYIESLNAALAKANTPSTESYAVIANQQSSWQGVKDSMQSIKPPSSFADAHARLTASVASITDGWSKLNVASGAQNAADFQAAEAQLSNSYAAVRTIKDEFSQKITDTQSKISAQASKL